MSLNLSKNSFPIRPNSAKIANSPSKTKPQHPPADLFLEFETFRSQIKKEYNDKILQTRSSNLQGELTKLKTTNSNKPPGFPLSNTFKTSISTTTLKPTFNSNSNIPLKSPKKENLEKTNFVDQAIKKGTSQIESLKRNLKELSAKKVDKNRESLLSAINMNKENRSLQNSEIKKPNDFKSLLSSFENPKPRPFFDYSNYKFGTTGALNEIENRAKLLVPSPTKRQKLDFFLDSSNKKTRLDSSESKFIGNKQEERKLFGKVLELQETLMDFDEQQLSECSNK